jgi:hypothetical protein
MYPLTTFQETNASPTVHALTFRAEIRHVLLSYIHLLKCSWGGTFGGNSSRYLCYLKDEFPGFCKLGLFVGV